MGAPFFKRPCALIDGGCRGNHVIDEQDVENRFSTIPVPVIGQAAQGGPRSKGTVEIEATGAAAARSLGGCVPNAPHQIRAEGDLHLLRHDSSEQIGLVVAATQPFHRVKGDGGHH